MNLKDTINDEMRPEKKEILDILKEIAKSNGEYILLINGSTAHLYPVIDNILLYSLGTDLEFTLDKIEDAFYNDNTFATIIVEDKRYDIDIMKKVEMKKISRKTITDERGLLKIYRCTLK